MEKREFKQISDNDLLAKMFTVGLTDTTVAFNLIEDGCFELTADELFTVLVILNSPEFYELIDAHNYAEERELEMHKAFDKAFDKLGTDDMTSEDLYDIASTSRICGSSKEHVLSIKYTIQNTTSWHAWTNTCRVYEALTGIPREWL